MLPETKNNLLEQCNLRLLQEVFLAWKESACPRTLDIMKANNPLLELFPKQPVKDIRYKFGEYIYRSKTWAFNETIANENETSLRVNMKLPHNSFPETKLLVEDLSDSFLTTASLSLNETKQYLPKIFDFINEFYFYNEPSINIYYFEEEKRVDIKAQLDHVTLIMSFKEGNPLHPIEDNLWQKRKKKP